MRKGSDFELHVIGRDVRGMDALILYHVWSLHPVLGVSALQRILGAAGCFVGLLLFVCFICCILLWDHWVCLSYSGDCLSLRTM